MRTSLILLCLLTTSALHAENWPSWRGPHANGTTTANPPIKWDEKTNIKWKIELPGRGSATPIICEEQIIVLTSVATDRVAKPDELPKRDGNNPTRTQAPGKFYQFWVISYDRQNGKELWRTKVNEAVPHEGHHETHTYAAGSPTTDGKTLFVSFGSFGIYALDLQGKILWKRDLGRMMTRLGWGEAVTPVLHKDALILNWDQEIGAKLIVLDAATGKTRWEAPREEKTSWNTPAVVEWKGKTQVIVNGTTRARSYDLATGKVIWEVGGMTTNAIPSPLIHEGHAILMSGYRGAAAVSVSLDSTGDLADKGVTAWRYSKGTPYVPSPVITDGKLFFTQANTGVLSILDVKTGKALLEGERLPKLGSIYSSPLVANGRIYLVDRSGLCVVFKADQSAEVLGTNQLEDTIDASPVAMGKTLYLRGMKTLYAIEEK